MQDTRKKIVPYNRYRTNGSAALKEAEAYQAPQKKKKENRKPEPEQTLPVNNLSVYYTCFLALAAVCIVWGCVHYLQLRAEGIALHKEIVAMEAQLEAKTLENDNAYHNVMNSVDMEEIKRIAMEEYGMAIPRPDQVVEYTFPDMDYVWQFRDVDGQG